MNNKNSTSRLVTCALLSLGFGFAAASQAMELQPEAAPPGIGFRAVGYDPPWLFELERRGGIRFIAEGRITIVSPVRDFIVNAAHGGVIYGNRTESQELLAEIVQLSCLDTTSGEQLSHTVTIRLDGREYHGCGRRISNAESADYASFGDRAPAPAR